MTLTRSKKTFSAFEEYSYLIVLPFKMLTNQHRFLPSTRVDTMQEERLAAEEAAHVATEEAIRKAEVQAAQKAKEATPLVCLYAFVLIGFRS